MAGKEQNNGTGEGSFDPVFLVHALQARGFQAVYERGLGHGYSMAIGQDETEAKVGVFPQVNTVEVVSGSSILRLEKIIRVRQRDEKLVLEALQDDELVTLQLSPDGRFSLTRQPLLSGDQTPTSASTRSSDSPAFVVTPKEPTVEPPQPHRQPPQHRERRHEERNAPATQPIEPTHQRAERQSAAMQQRERGENQRVTIRGRVGKEAHFRTSGRRGVLIGSFPLGEHPDLETTIWHTVVLFGDRAAKLKEKGLIPGQEIEIVGYVHERQVKGGDTGDGRKAKTIKEIYATAIRTTLRKPDATS